MTTTRVESLPATWDDARDLPFFRITDRLFPPEFCFGASVLLASYDDTVGTPAAAQPRPGTTTATSVDGETERERVVAPARLRRDR